jgi:hypothetical protein
MEGALGVWSFGELACGSREMERWELQVVGRTFLILFCDSVLGV